MTKKLLEEATVNRWKKLAGINEITRFKKQELDAEEREELKRAKEAEREAAAKAAKKAREASPEGQKEIKRDLYASRAISPATTKTTTQLAVQDDWEQDFLRRFGQELMNKFLSDETNLDVATSEAEAKMEKFITAYRDWFKQKGLSDYRSAVSSMNYPQQVEFEKPLYDMMNKIATEPFMPEEPQQNQPEEDDIESRITMTGDTDLSKSQVRQQQKAQKDLDTRGMFGAFGNKGFRGVAENKKRK